MIVNNVGIGNVDDNRKINFTSSPSGAFRITSSDGQQLQGDLSSNRFQQVTAPGSAPWKVEIGIESFSRTAVADGVTSQDVAFTAFFSFPSPPNGNHMFVSPIQGTED